MQLEQKVEKLEQFRKDLIQEDAYADDVTDVNAYADDDTDVTAAPTTDPETDNRYFDSVRLKVSAPLLHPLVGKNNQAGCSFVDGFGMEYGCIVLGQSSPGWSSMLVCDFEEWGDWSSCEIYNGDKGYGLQKRRKSFNLSFHPDANKFCGTQSRHCMVT